MNTNTGKCEQGKETCRTYQFTSNQQFANVLQCYGRICEKNENMYVCACVCVCVHNGAHKGHI